ncbi:MBL fold metallo-hydrolase [Azorhizobium oxalatiphilum]|uniref:MBL fold metallo-hydrolase n=1 Tax=Azorhizobium oxalatiphilum TaxID=980631 RepID=A0A917BJN7_9HYPH|nr:MBL fold metallo-hydrolase [Azorhizobium oxalatiphilum]GGF46006.1 MBL fold metallo-hydrolase [Azorhizobium oxalatiphilum]
MPSFLSRRAFLSGAAAVPLLTALPRIAPAAPLNAPFSVGAFTVLPILDGPFGLTREIVPEADSIEGERLVELAGLPKEGPWPVPVNVFAIRRGPRTYVVDAGGGSTMGADLGNAAERLAAVGVDLTKVDAVLMTHLHPDHAGGLFDDKHQAVFPNAELVVQQEEVAFWSDDGSMSRMPSSMEPLFQIARTALGAYQGKVRLVTGMAEAVPGITFIPLPGHTPGHAGLLLSDGNAQFLLFADTIQSALLQFPYPGWTTSFDVDPSLALASRRGILDRLAADGIPVTGSHISERGRIVTRGMGYAMVE